MKGYIKNSSNLVTALFVLAGILYYPTNARPVANRAAQPPLP